jgi:hypothetical protein
LAERSIGKSERLCDSYRQAASRCASAGSKSRPRENGQRRLNLIAECLAKAAADGEPWAIKECFDRVDGKPVRLIEAKIDPISTMTDEQLEAALKASLIALRDICEDEADVSRPN